jgi:hypothetical protein
MVALPGHRALFDVRPQPARGLPRSGQPSLPRPPWTPLGPAGRAEIARRDVSRHDLGLASGAERIMASYARISNASHAPPSVDEFLDESPPWGERSQTSLSSAHCPSANTNLRLKIGFENSLRSNAISTHSSGFGWRFGVADRVC